MSRSDTRSIPASLADALDLVPVPAFVTDVPGGFVIRRNQRARELCGHGPTTSARLADVVRGTGADEAPLPIDADPVAIAVRNGSPLHEAEAGLYTGSSWIPVAASIEPLRDSEGRVAFAVVVCLATPRRRDATISALKRSEQRLGLALSTARVGAWEFDLRTHRLTSSAQCKTNHGFGAGDDLQLEADIIPAIDPEHRERFRAAVDRAIAEQSSFEIEVPHRWPDGTPHWLLIAGRVADPTTMVGVSQDISERRHIEQALRESERRYREIVDTANEGIWRLDAQARITFVNQRMADLLGSTPAAMLGCHKWDFVFEQDVHAMESLFERRRQGVAEDVVDIRFRHHDGHEVWTLMAARPVYDASGHFIGALDLFTDITERRRAEQELRDSEDRFRTLADNIAQFAWMADARGWIFWYNRRWFEYTGQSLEAAQGWGWQRAHHPDYVDAVVAKIRRCFETGEPWEDTFPLRRYDGTYRWFLSRAVPIRDERGAVKRWFGTNTDVTEQREAEEVLREADRRKDEFLAVVAHELRGPLAPILTAVKLLQMKGPADPQLQRLRDTILRQTMQLSKLVDDLLEVGRVTTGKLRLDTHRVDVTRIVRDAIEACQPVIARRGHTLTTHLPDVPIEVEADAARLVQVISNLLTNAAKYMQDGGRLEVTALQQDRMAEIRVRDEGVGIARDMLDRIFQRFVQVGSSGHRAEGGLGIGLSLVKAVVEQHGGTVEARSDGIGRGSEFTVRLPVAAGVEG